ncbi:MAG TPA: nickel-dependent hydrogenase large subunit [Anaerolineae bacterium]|nr:nickel-dependent hydrogenase large subunit [Anaerolineae bacterium]
MSYPIPVDQHSFALQEHYTIKVGNSGPTVKEVNVEIGFSFRSVELLAQRRSYSQAIELVGRVCSLCANSHTLSFCLAAESIARLTPPARANYIRVIASEAERLHSHLLWCGVMAGLLECQPLFQQAVQARELTAGLLRAISGRPTNVGLNCIGGVTRDINDPLQLLADLAQLRAIIERQIIPAFEASPSLKARLTGLGVLSLSEARGYGVVGPMGRASGLKFDVRRDAPYSAYDQFDFDVICLREGDAFARLIIRNLEMLESVWLIEQALLHLPTGPICLADVPTSLPPGEAVARIEAPRGELFYYLASNGSDKPARLKIRTPTFANMPAAATLAVGQKRAEMPLLQASIDPCYACTDR